MEQCANCLDTSRRKSSCFFLQCRMFECRIAQDYSVTIIIHNHILIVNLYTLHMFQRMANHPN